MWTRFLRLLSPDSCASCGSPLASYAVFCKVCVLTTLPPPVLPEGVSASFAYGGAVAEALRAMKFRPDDTLLLPMQRLLVAKLPRDWPAFECVTPIPTTDRRLLERGFDATFALARAMAKQIGVPMRNVLRRIKDSPRMSECSRDERETAIAGAFMARKPAPDTVLVVDDIYTTGATFRAARDALLAAGATNILLHVIAATESELG
jgi:predicted amidophosphoribosyltransferase